MTRPFSPETLQQDFKALLRFTKSFIRNPISTIQREESWDYQRSAVFLVLSSLLSAALAGIFQASVGHAIISFILLPFISLAMAVMTSAILSYLIRFVHQRKLETERLFQLVVIAFFPFLIFRVFRSFAPPVTLIGLAATCALLIVGLSDRFQLPRKSVVKIISIFFALYLTYWGIDLIRHSNFRQMASQNIPEDSIKVLEQEFKTNE